MFPIIFLFFTPHNLHMGVAIHPLEVHHLIEKLKIFFSLFFFLSSNTLKREFDVSSCLFGSQSKS